MGPRPLLCWMLYLSKLIELMRTDYSGTELWFINEIHIPNELLNALRLDSPITSHPRLRVSAATVRTNADDTDRLLVMPGHRFVINCTLDGSDAPSGVVVSWWVRPTGIGGVTHTNAHAQTHAHLKCMHAFMCCAFIMHVITQSRPL